MVVGLTGGIGSGKTTVAKIFQKLGIPVYDSDSRAKELYSESSELRQKVIAHFGKDVYNGNKINRKKMADIVFANPDELNVLNALVHPLLQRDFETWYTRQSAPYVIREAAILIESGAYKTCDKVVVVTADEATRIKRVMRRDNVTKEEVKRRISNQLTDTDRLKLADYVIANDGSKSIILQVQQIDVELKAKS